MDHNNFQPEGVIAVFIPIITVIIIGIIIIYHVHTKSRLRQSIIEKGLVDENLKYLFNSAEPDPLKARLRLLKTGTVLIFFGIGLWVGFYYQSFGDDYRHFMAPSLFIFSGIGFILSFFLDSIIRRKEAARLNKKSE